MFTASFISICVNECHIVCFMWWWIFTTVHTILCLNERETSKKNPSNKWLNVRIDFQFSFGYQTFLPPLYIDPLQRKSDEKKENEKKIMKRKKENRKEKEGEGGEVKKEKSLLNATPIFEKVNSYATIENSLSLPKPKSKYSSKTHIYQPFKILLSWKKY